MLTPHVPSQWWFWYWDAGFVWADNGQRFAFRRCSVEWEKPPCAVFIHRLGSVPEMVGEDLVVGAYHGPAPIGFVGEKLIFRGPGEVYTIYEYDPAMRRYRQLVNGAIGGAELSPRRGHIAYFAGDDLRVFDLGTESASVVVRSVRSLSSMSGDGRGWVVTWLSPTRLEFKDLNDGGQLRREVDVSGTNLRPRR